MPPSGLVWRRLPQHRLLRAGLRREAWRHHGGDGRRCVSAAASLGFVHRVADGDTAVLGRVLGASFVLRISRRTPAGVRPVGAEDRLWCGYVDADVGGGRSWRRVSAGGSAGRG